MENNLKKANEMKRSISNILKRHPELKEFDRYNKLRNLGLRTRRNHLQSLSTFVDRVKKPFDKVTKRDVENFIISLDKKTKNSKEPYSENTKIQFKIKVKSFFRWFYKSNLTNFIYESKDNTNS